MDTTVLGLSKDEALEKPYIASMGVYVFKKEILLNLLRYGSLSVKTLGFSCGSRHLSMYFLKYRNMHKYVDPIAKLVCSVLPIDLI